MPSVAPVRGRSWIPFTGTTAPVTHLCTADFPFNFDHDLPEHHEHLPTAGRGDDCRQASNQGPGIYIFMAEGHQVDGAPSMDDFRIILDASGSGSMSNSRTRVKLSGGVLTSSDFGKDPSNSFQSHAPAATPT